MPAETAGTMLWYDMCVCDIGYLNATEIMEKQTYIRPEVEVTEICIERGFAVSDVDGEIESFDREDWG